jgi:hypothetical protein
MHQNASRTALDVQSLAFALNEECNGPSIALVSFVRAGLPLGVLLRRALVGMGRDAHHYGISIIRDRGIDMVALETIIQVHGAGNIVFVDGWTGKGAISDEVKRPRMACGLGGRLDHSVWHPWRHRFRARVPFHLAGQWRLARLRGLRPSA